MCVYVYTYCAQYRDGGGANEIKVIGTAVNAAYHRFTALVEAVRWVPVPVE